MSRATYRVKQVQENTKLVRSWAVKPCHNPSSEVKQDVISRNRTERTRERGKDRNCRKFQN